MKQCIERIHLGQHVCGEFDNMRKKNFHVAFFPERHKIVSYNIVFKKK